MKVIVKGEKTTGISGDGFEGISNGCEEISGEGGGITKTGG